MRLFRAIEMWCRKQAAAAVLPVILAGWLMGPSSQALTTFGKSNTYPPPPQPVPTIVPAFRCSRQTDCRIAANTSCVRTQYDSSTKCLCADNQPPNNGQCAVKTNKALHHICTTADDCAIELICKTLNISAELPSYLRVFTHLDKVCQCDTDSGYVEHDFICSGVADLMKSSAFIISILFAALKAALVYN